MSSNLNVTSLSYEITRSKVDNHFLMLECSINHIRHVYKNYCFINIKTIRFYQVSGNHLSTRHSENKRPPPKWPKLSGNNDERSDNNNDLTTQHLTVQCDRQQKERKTCCSCIISYW